MEDARKILIEVHTYNSQRSLFLHRPPLRQLCARCCYFQLEFFGPHDAHVFSVYKTNSQAFSSLAVRVSYVCTYVPRGICHVWGVAADSCKRVCIFYRRLSMSPFVCEAVLVSIHSNGNTTFHENANNILFKWCCSSVHTSDSRNTVECRVGGAHGPRGKTRASRLVPGQKCLFLVIFYLSTNSQLTPSSERGWFNPTNDLTGYFDVISEHRLPEHHIYSTTTDCQSTIHTLLTPTARAL